MDRLSASQDRLTAPRKQAIRLGFLGLLMMFLSVKFVFQGGFERREPLPLDGRPALVLFSLDDPCECIQEMIGQADAQVRQWPEEGRAGLPIHRVDFEARRDLAAEYQVFRVPCLVLLDAGGEVVYRQDYPSIEGGPFALDDFEAQIRSLSLQYN